MRTWLRRLYRNLRGEWPGDDPATPEHQLLRDRVFLQVGRMPIECAREMNGVFDRHYGIETVAGRELPYAGDD